MPSPPAPQAGKFNSSNENDDVIVHTQNGDFSKLATRMDWHAVTINGSKRWPGAADYACEQ
jgi:hypothetical protein